MGSKFKAIFWFWWIVAITFVHAMSSSSTTKQVSKPLIVFLHGSGDTGRGAQAWIESLVPPQVYRNWDWVFPTAKPIPYQLNGGLVSSVWYDRKGGFAPTYPEQTATVERSTEQILQVLDEQVAQGRDPSSIVLGGFSMGGAMAYQTGVRWHGSGDRQPLGAIFGLSCYLNQDSKVWSLIQEAGSKTLSQWPPTYVAHGNDDDFILPSWGQATAERFQKAGLTQLSFRTIPYLHHEMTASEWVDILEFIQQSVTPTTLETAKQDSSSSEF